MTASNPRLRWVAFYRGGEFDHFYFYGFIDWTPGSWDIDCQSPVENREILAATDILSAPKFVTFSSMAEWYNQAATSQAGQQQQHT